MSDALLALTNPLPDASQKAVIEFGISYPHSDIERGPCEPERPCAALTVILPCKRKPSMFGSYYKGFMSQLPPRKKRAVID